MKTEQALLVKTVTQQRTVCFASSESPLAWRWASAEQSGLAPADSRSVAAQLGNSGLIMAVVDSLRIYAFAGCEYLCRAGAQCCRWTAGHTFMLVGHMVEFGGFLAAGAIGLLRTSSMAYLAVALTEYAAGLFSYNAAFIRRPQLLC